MQKCYLGIDVGSVSTNLVLLNSQEEILNKKYVKTKGKPIKVIQDTLAAIKKDMNDMEISGVGTTGSGRRLAGTVVGADVVKNEITAHSVAAASTNPEVKTVLEIGGQDSKIIILRDGVAVDFAMNSVCAAGTGSFLEQQAARLEIPIEKFGDLALKAEEAVRIAGRCSVFAESDMIHKQQMGHGVPEIVAGLCEALVRNYLNNVGKGKNIEAPIVFQGGVAANNGIQKAFEKELKTDLEVPQNYEVMGAIGAALLAREREGNTSFRGFDITSFEYETKSFICEECPNGCEIINILQNGDLLARWGGKCTRWQ